MCVSSQRETVGEHQLIGSIPTDSCSGPRLCCSASAPLGRRPVCSLSQEQQQSPQQHLKTLSSPARLGPHLLAPEFQLPACVSRVYTGTHGVRTLISMDRVTSLNPPCGAAHSWPPLMVKTLIFFLSQGFLCVTDAPV